MTSEAKQWRNQFAACEEEQLRRFPLRELETPLEHAQYEVALHYLKAHLPAHNWTGSSERSTAFRADEPTRHAFFEHFQGVSSRDIFCLRNNEWEDMMKHLKGGDIGLLWYSTHHHEFAPFVPAKPTLIGRKFGWALPEGYDQQSLFFRYFGFSSSIMSGEGWRELWHWDGANLIQLPGYNLHSCS